MSVWIRLAGAALLALALLGGAPSGASDGAYLPPEQQDAWAQQLATAKQRVDAAEQRLAEAEAAYARARHDQYPRGEALAKIERERSDARRDLAAARKELDALVEEARRAGVLPEVLRPYW